MSDRHPLADRLNDDMERMLKLLPLIADDGNGLCCSSSKVISSGERLRALSNLFLDLLGKEVGNENLLEFGDQLLTQLEQVTNDVQLSLVDRVAGAKSLPPFDEISFADGLSKLSKEDFTAVLNATISQDSSLLPAGVVSSAIGPVLPILLGDAGVLAAAPSFIQIILKIIRWKQTFQTVLEYLQKLLKDESDAAQKLDKARLKKIVNEIPAELKRFDDAIGGLIGPSGEIAPQFKSGFKCRERVYLDAITVATIPSENSWYFNFVYLGADSGQTRQIGTASGTVSFEAPVFPPSGMGGSGGMIRIPGKILMFESQTRDCTDTSDTVIAISAIERDSIADADNPANTAITFPGDLPSCISAEGLSSSQERQVIVYEDGDKTKATIATITFKMTIERDCIDPTKKPS